MKIKSYLAILVLIALVGGNGVRYLLSKNYEAVSMESHAHLNALLWQKDFQRISADTRQYLISSDLIIGSGETYLASGTVHKGNLIVNDLTELSERNNLLDSRSMTKLIATVRGINNINRFIQQTAESNVSDRRQELAATLEQYDQIASAISFCVENIEAQLSNAIEINSLQLDQMQDGVKSHSLIILAIFSLLVVLSWYWANRTICRPIQQLRNATISADSGQRFKGTSIGPLEIRQLSDSFSELTRSLSFQASHDHLTKLYNRRAFGRAMVEFFAESQEDLATHSLCFIDLDHFKGINDSCGHAAGDEMLVHIAHILTEHIRTSDIVARLGGDEFAILLHKCPLDEAQVIANTIRKAIRNFKFQWNSQNFHIGASIGITEINASGGQVQDMLNTADIACMMAKKTGRDVVRTFDSCEELLNKKRLDAISVNQIKEALQEDRFELFRQKIIPLQNTPQGQHYEMLLRMRSKEGSLVSPGDFLPIVESYGLGAQIDEWVINASIDWLNKNPQELEGLDMCSINLSGQSVACPETKKIITEKINNVQFPANKLCFEITETAAISNLEYANDLIATLREYGCLFALDDFGSGLSSFAYLKNLKVDLVKIDGAFVRDMLINKSDMATVKAINDVAKATGKKTIAEFVENAEVAEALSNIGIDYGQGYHFDRPSPLPVKHKPSLKTALKNE